MDFGKCQDNFGQFFWYKNDSDHLRGKLQVVKKNDNKDFRLVQNITMGEADFNQLMRLRNELVTAAENLVERKTCNQFLIPTVSKDMDEQLKLAHKVVDVVDRANRELSDSAAVQCGQAREFLSSSPISCLSEKVITNQPICPKKSNFIYLLYHFPFYSS